MARCAVGRWKDSLDKEDRKAFEKASSGAVWYCLDSDCNGHPPVSRADLHATICEAEGRKLFALTTLKDCLNGRCICD